MNISNSHGAMIVCWFDTPFDKINQPAIDEFKQAGLLIESNGELSWHQDAIKHYNEYQEWLRK
jgi:hypothetical protein